MGEQKYTLNDPPGLYKIETEIEQINKQINKPSQTKQNGNKNKEHKQHNYKSPSSASNN